MEEKVRHMLRVFNTDVDGSKTVYIALTKVKGIGFPFSNMVCSIAGIKRDRKAGTLTDAEVAKLDEIIRNPQKFGAPAWMLNRRKDIGTGSDKHLLKADLDFTKDNDIKLMRMIRCYKGIRHSFGLPVRGQRTKSNFRKTKSRGGGAIGVVKSRTAKAAIAEKDKEGKAKEKK